MPFSPFSCLIALMNIRRESTSVSLCQGKSQYFTEWDVVKIFHSVPGLLVYHAWAFNLSNAFTASIGILILFSSFILLMQ